MNFGTQQCSLAVSLLALLVVCNPHTSVALVSKRVPSPTMTKPKCARAATGMFATSSRREALETAISVACSLGAVSTTAASSAQAAMAPTTATVVSQLLSTQASSAELPVGLLDARVTENVQSPPPYGMELPDIYYPEWFSGTWAAASTTREILAPCGVALFGGNATYQRALTDIGNVLKYESRFVADQTAGAPKETVIADREFNVKSIAKQAMGENSVVDISMATPNKFSCLLAPKGSPSMLQVDLLVLNRRQENVSPNQFDCSEVVREIASPVDRPKNSQTTASILKEIETANLYTYLPEKDQIRCIQRSAAFLLPSNDNPMALRMWQASGGRAIDVRYYDIIYTRNN